MMLLLKNLVFTIVVPGTVAVLIPLLLVGDTPIAMDSRVALALLLFVAGGAVYSWCVWDFASFGRGTPAPIDAPKRLVVRGLYRFSRNPMYVGVLTIIVAWAVLFLSVELLLYGAVVATMFNFFIRLYEEPHLEGEFGDEYSAYKDRVGRWLPQRAGTSH